LATASDSCLVVWPATSRVIVGPITWVPARLEVKASLAGADPAASTASAATATKSAFMASLLAIKD